MRQFEIVRKLFDQDITAQVLCLDEGVHVSLFGGERAHIGAVSIVDTAGVCSTVQFPTHKEGVISAQWAEALAGRGCRPAVVEVGIHYDNLSREGIAAVVALTDKMLEAVLSGLFS